MIQIHNQSPFTKWEMSIYQWLESKCSDWLHSISTWILLLFHRNVQGRDLIQLWTWQGFSSTSGRVTRMRAAGCGPKFAGQYLRANICGPHFCGPRFAGHIFAGQNLRVNICGPKFAGQYLRAKICGSIFAGQHLRATFLRANVCGQNLRANIWTNIYIELVTCIMHLLTPL